jgi:hypothetical protein
MTNIKLYGLDLNPKKCNKCERPNNSLNTLCWYCNSRFEKIKTSIKDFKNNVN